LGDEVEIKLIILFAYILTKRDENFEHIFITGKVFKKMYQQSKAMHVQDTKTELFHALKG
jgi:uncharacterized membrane protein YbaN (DUF454 family)